MAVPFLGSASKSLAVWVTFPVPELEEKLPKRVTVGQLDVAPCLLGCMRNTSEEVPGLKISYLCFCKSLNTINRPTEPCAECCRQQLLVFHLLLLSAAVALAF